MHNKLKKEKELNAILKNTIKLQQDTIKSFGNNNNNQHLENKLNKVLSGMFTDTQIKLIMEPKQKVYKWTEDDIASAITLRSLSPKTYRYLRNEKKYPLPGYKTNTI
uniref:THAP9-like helix-turn-helix domain-containing protein n=1 Tax=Schizaphis graminum TaxID=13262 RepID=A0A2S2P567_SCHGA